MVIISLFSWWYTAGWADLISRCGNKVKGALNFFSVPLLLGSLFAPFRQISAGQVRGPLGVQFRAWGDRLFSRVIGAFIRSILIIIGLITTVFAAVAAFLGIILWPFLPVMPVIGLLLMTWRL